MNGTEANAIDFAAAPPEAERLPAPLPARRGPWLQFASLRGFEWNRLELPIEGLCPALHGLRILHLTDLHLRAHWSGIFDQFLQTLADDPPDLILFTGDFVENRIDSRPALPTLRRFVARLSSRLGTYAIIGNHDGDLLAPQLPPLGVNLINGRYARLSSPEGSIELIGLPGVIRTDLTPAFLEQIPPRTPGVPRLVLAHFPDQVMSAGELRPDVVLAGHTHGGQICLPNGRPLLTHDSLPKPLARGVHRVNNTMLVVNRGFGFARLALRLFCPAEVIELTCIPSKRPQPVG